MKKESRAANLFFGKKKKPSIWKTEKVIKGNFVETFRFACSLLRCFSSVVFLLPSSFFCCFFFCGCFCALLFRACVCVCVCVFVLACVLCCPFLVFLIWFLWGFCGVMCGLSVFALVCRFFRQGPKKEFPPSLFGSKPSSRWGDQYDWLCFFCCNNCFCFPPSFYFYQTFSSFKPFRTSSFFQRHLFYIRFHSKLLYR